jgi:tRNA pseudouridine55 synthase
MSEQLASFNAVDEFRSATGGVLLVDKPQRWTSFDVVKKIRGMFRVPKVGHAGTLDPMATGLLILASQTWTRRIDVFQALEKSYEGTMRLGAVTPSYDADTEVCEHRAYEHVTFDTLCAAAATFIGEIEQLPPMYSAVKVGGRRLYAMARKGETIERQPRPVTIMEFEMLDYSAPDVRFRVRCSKGTYVRSLAHDLGEQLGCGAHLTALRRTSIGAYDVAEAWSIDTLTALAQTLRATESVPDGVVEDVHADR